ncbi:MAG TPA: FKBP-type peptidyl-prolyl cis-trans isomerase [Planctomycetaceae bacterium]|jgi:peptidylprolyl isomerase|nr:FKBP-type peptidyl-prolyl cis-trans isomerase [Planctomycetaceae bacterium]
MLLSWAHQITAWIKRNQIHAGRRAHARRRITRFREYAPLAQLECLESRQMLTAVVGVQVSGNSIHLTELRNADTTTQEGFSVSYTSSQVVLTGTNGTTFKVGNQTLATDTINITAPPSIAIQLNQHANDVSISGDGTASLSSLRLRLSMGQQSNSITLNSVIADQMSIRGRRPNDTVTLNQSTIKGNLNASLGNSSTTALDLESTTVSGNLSDRAGQVTMNGSTVTGKLHNVQPGQNTTLNSTDTTYTGAAMIKMGPSGVINLMSSNSGSNLFQSAVTIKGTAHKDTTINQDPGSVFFSVNPTSHNATFNTTNPTLGTPTVNSQTITTNTAPVITGTFDSVNTSVLTVAANGSTFTLGSSSQLTSPAAGRWSLNLGSATLTSPTTTVTVTSVDHAGNQKSGSGTITDGSGIIAKYLAANNLTATTTADGLNYVIVTHGSGAVPTAGKTVTVNYSGFLLNSDSSIGTEFDSNTDSQFGHVTPFSFTLGAGQVIKGWDEAFALLPVGTVAQLIIPPTLAYGAAGSPPSIPSNAILIFNVTVVSAV